MPDKTDAAFFSLKKNIDFKRVYRSGKSAANKILVVYTRKNGLDYCRFGFSISKKVGKAVVRNKIRRRLREAIRVEILAKTQVAEIGRDFVIIARQPAADAGYDEMKKGIFYLMKKLTEKS